MQIMTVHVTDIKVVFFFVSVVITLKLYFEHVESSVLGPHSFPFVMADTKNRETENGRSDGCQ